MKLKDKVVIITGASSGIGVATAIKFGEQKSKVVVNYRSDIQGAKRVVDTIDKDGGLAISIKADVSSPEEVENLFKATINKFGRVDVLINNAGFADEPPFLEASVKDWQETFNTDLLGTMLCSQRAAKIMLKQKSGKIINTASIYGIDYGGREALIAYSAAKAAIVNFTKTLAKLLAPTIHVNAVAPGYILTPPWDRVSEEIKTRNIDRTYLKRWIKPDEIGDAFVYLATADAITGEVLVVDAGRSLMDY